MKRRFRNRRWGRWAIATLLVVAGLLLRTPPSADRSADWLPPGAYRVQQVVDERHLLLRSRTRSGLHAPIRLLGIAQPEPWPEPLRLQAIQRLSKLAEHQTIRLRLDRRRVSHDGKLLGYVFVGEHLLNADLVAHGLAVSATRPEDCHTLVRQIKEAESEARAAQRGIWRYRQHKS